MKKVAWFVLVVLGVAFPAVAGPKKKTITLYGSNNAAVDRQAIQNAIDTVKMNGTVELVGTFQLDGEMIFVNRDHVTIAGRAVDNDLDGAVNEDWADGLDNDGDGQIDEDDWDAVVQGIVDIDGLPVRDLLPPAYEFFNRGFAIWGADKNWNKIVIRDLKLTGLNRPIMVSGDTIFHDGFLCDDVEFTDGTIHNAVIEGNWFDNTVRGVQLWGVSRGVTVADNLMTQTQGGGVLLVSGASGCLAADGSASSVEVGVPADATIVGNVIVDKLGGGGIQVFGGQGTSVLSNRVDGAAHGIYIESDTTAEVSGNVVANVNNGIFLARDGANATISNNAISDVGFAGIFFTEATGFLARDNSFVNVGGFDYFLDEFSSGNRVTLLAGQTYLDLGTGNIIQ